MRKYKPQPMTTRLPRHPNHTSEKKNKNKTRKQAISSATHAPDQIAQRPHISVHARSANHPPQCKNSCPLVKLPLASGERRAERRYTPPVEGRSLKADPVSQNIPGVSDVTVGYCMFEYL
jgi:hypothetical protein